MTRRRDRRVGLAVRLGGGVGGVLVGIVLVVGTMALGACDAFGGPCPSSPGLDGDVHGGIAVGLALLVAAPILASRPDRGGAVLALAAALPVAAVGAYVLGRATLS